MYKKEFSAKSIISIEKFLLPKILAESFVFNSRQKPKSPIFRMGYPEVLHKKIFSGFLILKLANRTIINN